MKLKLGAIQIFVSDIRKARKWYSEVVGMELILENAEFSYLLMELEGTCFCIETPNPKWGEGWNKAKIGGRTPIILETADIRQAAEELKEKGVTFVEEVSKRPWGEYKAVFSDPDGNEINLVQAE